MLSEQQIKELASQLEQAISQEVEEVSEEEVFKNAIWTVENLDRAVQGKYHGVQGIGFPFPSEEVVRNRKAQILNNLCFVVAETWAEITDNPELQALGEKALNIISDELEKVEGSL